jgi:hypothetical protein
MGAVDQGELEDFENEIARLDAEWTLANPDLVAQGWDREDWEAFEHSLEKDD